MYHHRHSDTSECSNLLNISSVMIQCKVRLERDAMFLIRPESLWIIQLEISLNFQNFRHHFFIINKLSSSSTFLLFVDIKSQCFVNRQFITRSRTSDNNQNMKARELFDKLNVWICAIDGERSSMKRFKEHTNFSSSRLLLFHSTCDVDCS